MERFNAKTNRKEQRSTMNTTINTVESIVLVGAVGIFGANCVDYNASESSVCRSLRECDPGKNRFGWPTESVDQPRPSRCEWFTDYPDDIASIHAPLHFVAQGSVDEIGMEQREGGWSVMRWAAFIAACEWSAEDSW